MEFNFWNTKWQNSQLGFHQDEIHPSLQLAFKGIDLSFKTVFVPLCGKTKDMLWLASQGAKVIGVEFVEQAIIEFEQEHAIGLTKKGDVYESDRIKIFNRDIFKIESKELGQIDYVFDRAALVALDPKTRYDYSRFMQSLDFKDFYLLIGMDYDQSLRSGPPFSINNVEVSQLFSWLKTNILMSYRKKQQFADIELEINFTTYKLEHL